jgi:hypothetical protein
LQVQTVDHDVVRFDVQMGDRWISFCKGGLGLGPSPCPPPSLSLCLPIPCIYCKPSAIFCVAVKI